METLENLHAEIASRLDNELYEMLAPHGFNFKGKTIEAMKGELEKKGYELIIEQKGDTTEARYVYKLCRIVDTRKFKIKVNLNVDFNKTNQ